MSTKTTILLIDDKPANVFALEKLLEKPNRIFLNAYNGKDGLKKALDNDIDLIILDVQMPHMDGFEVAQILKSNKKTRDNSQAFLVELVGTAPTSVGLSWLVVYRHSTF